MTTLKKFHSQAENLVFMIHFHHEALDTFHSTFGLRSEGPRSIYMGAFRCFSPLSSTTILRSEFFAQSKDGSEVWTTSTT